jgi:hypothetical protein
LQFLKVVHYKLISEKLILTAVPLRKLVHHMEEGIYGMLRGVCSPHYTACSLLMTIL